ncbi:branched-chain alpha-keto acid dehydrogenase subunit E2 [Candidatus Marinamargulisbacteria bacterium SCGC AG-410-N11]|nr:branched-chain alpha-keto acid dehydrogenase subunit E2 [Candidatus Marinamargulisbacteria bacterium SCGC AG-410-N11]
MDFKLPNLGDGVEKAIVSTIFVGVGDAVKLDQPIMELETDKAVAPIPATVEGKITAILVKEGDTVATGNHVVTIETNGGAPQEPVAQNTAPPQAAPIQPSVQTPVPVATQAQPVQPATTITPMVANSAQGFSSPTGAEPPCAPSIRKLAYDLGLNLSLIQGSGRGGRILRSDIRQYIQYLQQLSVTPQQPQPVETTASTPAPKKSESIDFSKWGPVQEENVSMMRQKIAEKMTESWTQVPHVTQFGEADITDLMDLRKKYNPIYEKQSAKITVTVFAIKAIVAALKAFPVFNSSYDTEKQVIVYKDYYHCGIAVDTEYGLVVPVIRDVDKKSVLELSQELQQVAEKARDRKLSIDDMRGGTFTISNLGGLNAGPFTPIVNTPEVGIIGMGRGEYKPVINPKTKKGKIRLFLPLCLSYDHRVIDGADGARFINTFIQALQEFPESELEGVE